MEKGGYMTQYELLFSERKKIGKNLYEILKQKGYTKISFSKKVNISRPTLDHLFEGEINSITTFEKHLKKISAELEVEISELLMPRKENFVENSVVYSNNEPKDYVAGNVEKELFDVLESLIDLCDLYY